MFGIKKYILGAPLVVTVLTLGGTAVLHAQQPTQTPPVETDARLHSNGNGWKLNKANITDKSLPRVLLIGDSILAGYQKFVIEELKGKVYIDAWVQPYHLGGDPGRKLYLGDRDKRGAG